MEGPRPADAREAGLLWPVVDAARLFASRAAYEEFVADGSWRVRITGAGGAEVLDRWRQHLTVLAIRGLWAPAKQVPTFVRDAREVARAHGMERVLSPLVSLGLFPPYREAGMTVLEQVVAFRARPSDVAALPFPEGIDVRRGEVDDISRVVDVDRDSFSEFWGYGEAEIQDALRYGRIAVACAGHEIIGYSLLTVNRGVGMLARVAVMPSHRGQGVGAALVGDAARYTERSSASELTLCTQAENTRARRLYARLGLTELPEAYVLAVTESQPTR